MEYTLYLYNTYNALETMAAGTDVLDALIAKPREIWINGRRFVARFERVEVELAEDARQSMVSVKIKAKKVPAIWEIQTLNPGTIRVTGQPA